MRCRLLSSRWGGANSGERRRKLGAAAEQSWTRHWQKSGCERARRSSTKREEWIRRAEEVLLWQPASVVGGGIN